MILHDYEGGTLERRTRASGKSRYTVSYRSRPLVINTDPKALGAGPALAIAEHLRQRILGIAQQASAATMRARLSAQAALVRGEAWVRRRYSGGRIGTRPPARSDRLFNDSGRFAESIAARAAGDGYTVNVAANRLDPTTFNGGEPALLRMVARLRALVPEFGDARELANALPVRRAIRDAAAGMIRVAASSSTVSIQAELARAIASELRSAIMRAAG